MAPMPRVIKQSPPKKHYNIESSARSDWLTGSIHLPVGCTLTSVCSFVLFLGNFFSSMLTENILPIFLPVKYESLIILPDKRTIIPVSYQILSLSFLPGLHLRDLLI